MKNKIRRYHPQFVADLRIATSYYDDISINLGNRLRATIQKHLELISDSPVGLGLVFVTRAQRVIPPMMFGELAFSVVLQLDLRNFGYE